MGPSRKQKNNRKQQKTKMETKRSRRIAVKGVLPALKVNEEKNE